MVTAVSERVALLVALAVVLVLATVPVLGAVVAGVVYGLGRYRDDEGLVALGVGAFVLQLVVLALAWGVG